MIATLEILLSVPLGWLHRGEGPVQYFALASHDAQLYVIKTASDCLFFNLRVLLLNKYNRKHRNRINTK